MTGYIFTFQDDVYIVFAEDLDAAWEVIKDKAREHKWDVDKWTKRWSHRLVEIDPSVPGCHRVYEDRSYDH